MASSSEYLNFILEQLSGIDGITHRMMMGEYIIYLRGKIAAYICDDTLLVKPVKSALKYVSPHILKPPYDGAKDMLLIENVDDREYLCGLFNAIYDDLPAPKTKKK